MSFGYASERLSVDRTMSAAAAATQTVYERPSEWLNLPTLLPTENKLVGLLAVFNNSSNFVAVNCAAVGGYTVDWGDGSAPVTVATSTQANYTYNYAATPGSATSRGYKQVIVTITPVVPGTAFTTVNLNVRHPSVARAYTVPWLDIAFSGPSLTVLPGPGVTPVINMGMLECLTAYSGTYNGSFALADYNSLAQVRLIGTTTINTSATFMFRNCSRLVNVSPITFSTATPVTTMASMFDSCSSLAVAPFILNTGSVNSTVSMFNSCRSLTTIPKYTTSAVVTANSMFSNCSSLTSIPWLTFNLVTNGSSMFSSCSKLTTIPVLNFSAATNLSSLFSGCTSLISIEIITTSALANASGMFQNCSSLVSINIFTATGITNASSMFQSCFSLVVIPALDFAAITNAGNMFNACRSLIQINCTFNNVGTLTTTTMFNSAPSLARLTSATIGNTFSITNCNLSGPELNEVYSALPSVTGKTITVTGNWGTATDDPTIATAKGWVVTG